MPAVTNQGQVDMNLSCGIDIMFSGVGYLHFTGMIAAGNWERARVMETSSRRTLRGPSRSSQSQVNSRSSLSTVPGRARRSSCTTAVGTHAESDRAAHAGTAQTAVSVGDLVQVLLVVGLGVVERASGRNLRGNRIVTGTPKRLVVGVTGLLSGPALLVA